MIPREGPRWTHPLQFNKNADFIKNWVGRDSLPDNARYSMGRQQWSRYTTWCESIGFVFDEETKRFKEVEHEHS